MILLIICYLRMTLSISHSLLCECVCAFFCHSIFFIDLRFPNVYTDENKKTYTHTHTQEWKCIYCKCNRNKYSGYEYCISLLPSFLLNIKVIIIYNFVVEMSFIRSITESTAKETITKKKMGSFLAHLHAVCQYLQCILCMCASSLFVVIFFSFSFVSCENGLWFHCSNVPSSHSHSTIYIYRYM